MIQLRNVVFKEAGGHRTLPLAQDKAPADLHHILDITTGDNPAVLPDEATTTTDATTMTHSTPDPALNPTEIQPKVNPHAPPSEVRQSSRLAAQTVTMPPTPPPIDLPTLNEPESEEETYHSMPGALSLNTAGNNNTWIPKSYSEAMTRLDLWKEPMDVEMARMKERE
ncbi:hypothetical protein C0992_006276, partial [Termitomyces sp. T32_za158]